MRCPRIIHIVLGLFALLALTIQSAQAGTTFTYQGRLTSGGAVIDDFADLQFLLFDDPVAGTQIGTTVEFLNYQVVNGLITVDLDYGSGAFDGTDRWLEIQIRMPVSAGVYSVLTPRPKIQSAPYAQFAENVNAVPSSALPDGGTWDLTSALQIGGGNDFVGVNRDYAVGSEWFGVHAPVSTGYGGMYVTTDGATAKPFYGYHTGTERAWHYIDGSTGDWHLYVDGDRLTVTDEGDVGIGTKTPAHRLHVRGNGDKTIFGEATSTSIANVGVHGTTASSNGFSYGVMGEVTNLAGTGVGVYGEAPFYGVMGRANDNGVAILGYSQGIGAYGEGQTGEGVLGVTYSSNVNVAGVTGYGDNRGVYGKAQAIVGNTAGVYGLSSSRVGAGVHGVNDAIGGFNYGVLGELTDPVATGSGVLGRAQFYGVTGEATGAGVGVTGRSSLGVYGESTVASGTGVMGANTASSGTTYGVYGTVNSSSGYAGYFLGRGYFQNDLGIGTTPVYRLDVREASTSANMAHLEREADAAAGSDLLEMRMGTASADGAQFIECERGSDIEFRVWANGDVSADGVFTAGGADFAEMIKVNDGADSVEPGDVLVIDIENLRAVTKSAAARSTLVAGIYSTSPGLLGSEHDWDQLAKKFQADEGEFGDRGGEAEAMRPLDLGTLIDEVPLAVVGIVPCKVSAENGSILPGDLLVTSSIPGHAMRDENPRAGTIVGKALGALDKGTGVIKVLVTVQ